MAVGVLYQEQGACTLLLDCLWLTFPYVLYLDWYCIWIVLLSPLFVLLTCPLFGTRNYCDLEIIMRG